MADSSREPDSKKFSLFDLSDSLVQNACSAGQNGYISIAGFLIAWILFLWLFWFSPAGLDNLPAPGRATLAITAWALVIWITGAIPAPVTGMAIPLLLVLTKAIPQIPIAYSGFTNDTSFLVLGTFVFSAVMGCVGLDKRIALAAIGRASEISSIISGIFVANTISALFIPATVSRATTYFPVVQGIKNLFAQNDSDNRIKKALSIAAIGFSSSIGAPLFLTSHLPNVVVVATLAKTSGVEITWIKWLMLNFPMIGMAVIIYFWVCHHFGLRKIQLEAAAEVVEKAKNRLGPMQQVEMLILFSFALAVILWVTEPLHHIQTGMVTLMALMLLFVPGFLSLKWNVLQEKTMWGTWLLLAGSLSLSSALSTTGAAKIIAATVFNYIPHTHGILVLIVVMLIVQVFRLGIASSVAAISLFAPILAALAPMLQLNPVPLIMAICVLDPFTFIIPIELASCVVAYGTGDFSFGDFFKAGAPITVMAILFILLVMLPWWSFLGFPL